MSFESGVEIIPNSKLKTQNSKLTMKHWISAARPRTLPLALSSILMGSFLAAGSHAFSWTIFGLAVLTTTFLQILSNFANDYGDTVSGVDTVERTVATRAVQTGAITRQQMTRAIILMSILSFISGSLLIFKGLENTSTQIKKLYNELEKTPEYQVYILAQSRDKKSEKDIITFIFSNLMLPGEEFVSHVEEHFTNWDDDAEMINQLMLNYLQKPGSYNLQEMVSKEKWDFARTLLTTTREKKAYALELIKPKLKNWDADRIAVLDMILMEMGVCELLYFDTIPTKVTINEYIDLAKSYSTPQSGHFVNGILDNIHKELMTQDKIHKVNFKQNAS